jgi:hypothetical protein
VPKIAGDRGMVVGGIGYGYEEDEQSRAEKRGGVR